MPLLQSGLDKNELGALVGRVTLAALGITAPALAAGLGRIASRVEIPIDGPQTDDDTRR